jgi:hypothetical protein
VAALIKETEGRAEEFPSGMEVEGSKSKIEVMVEEQLETGGSGELFGPARAELRTECGSDQKCLIWPADQSIDRL